MRGVSSARLAAWHSYHGVEAHNKHNRGFVVPVELGTSAPALRAGDNGQIRVLIKGFDENGKWREAEDREKFAREKDEGYLKVSFFGPFFGAYAVFNLGENYSQTYVAGDDRSYLWFLSRTPDVSEAQKQVFVDQAQALDFPVDELIFVDQSLGDRL